MQEATTTTVQFPAMIDDWRDKWHIFAMQQTDPIFGFGFVQV